MFIDRDLYSNGLLSRFEDCRIRHPILSHSAIPLPMSTSHSCNFEFTFGNFGSWSLLQKPLNFQCAPYELYNLRKNKRLAELALSSKLDTGP